MTQIERLSSAGELLYPVDGSGRAAASQSAAATSSGGGGRGGASSRRPPSLADHNYGVASRPIDEWAVNRRINLELAAERASHFREAADADAAAAAAIAAEDPTVNVLNEADVATATEPVVDSARLLGGGERLPTYDEAIRRQQQQQQDHHVPEELRLPTYETSTRSTARMSRRALQLRHSYHHRIPPRLTLPRQHSRVAAAVTSTATAASTAASGRPLLRLERNSSHEGMDKRNVSFYHLTHLFCTLQKIILQHDHKARRCPRPRRRHQPLHLLQLRHSLPDPDLTSTTWTLFCSASCASAARASLTLVAWPGSTDRLRDCSPSEECSRTCRGRSETCGGPRRRRLRGEGASRRWQSCSSRRQGQRHSR